MTVSREERPVTSRELQARDSARYPQRSSRATRLTDTLAGRGDQNCYSGERPPPVDVLDPEARGTHWKIRAASASRHWNSRASRTRCSTRVRTRARKRRSRRLRARIADLPIVLADETSMRTVSAVHAWTERKATTMKPEKIRGAWFHLKDRGLLSLRTQCRPSSSCCFSMVRSRQ
jgi:hypothetical protein